MKSLLKSFRGMATCLAVGAACVHFAVGEDPTPTPSPTPVPPLGAVPVITFEAKQTAVLYGMPDNTGAGQMVGIIGWAGPGELGVDLDSVRDFFTDHDLPVPSFTVVTVGEQTNSPKNLSGELHMDGEITGTYVPGAQIRYYLAIKSGEGISAAFRQALADGCDVLTCSYGSPIGPWENDWSDEEVSLINAALKAVADAGVTACIASGDYGAGRVAFPAASPYVLAVGGIQVPAASGLQEVYWNYLLEDKTESYRWISSGGGVAPGAVPWWQAKVNPLSFPINGMRFPGRGVPDVAAMGTGNDGWNGTSACAPFWASLIARINVALGRDVGFINPIIYSLGPGSPAFHDITVGNNIPPVDNVFGFPAVGYEAKAGWDPCTGWGTPNGIELLGVFRDAFFGPKPKVAVRERKRLGARGQRIELRGTAAGHFEVVSVSVRANGKLLIASGTGRWKAVVPLRRGNNRISIQAKDVADKASAPKTFVIRRS